MSTNLSWFDTTYEKFKTEAKAIVLNFMSFMQLSWTLIECSGSSSILLKIWFVSVLIKLISDSVRVIKDRKSPPLSLTRSSALCTKAGVNLLQRQSLVTFENSFSESDTILTHSHTESQTRRSTFVLKKETFLN